TTPPRTPALQGRRGRGEQGSTWRALAAPAWTAGVTGSRRWPRRRRAPRDLPAWPPRTDAVPPSVRGARVPAPRRPAGRSASPSSCSLHRLPSQADVVLAGLQLDRVADLDVEAEPMLQAGAQQGEGLAGVTGDRRVVLGEGREVEVEGEEVHDGTVHD